MSAVVHRMAHRRHAKTWYVDNALGSNGNGLTWTTAWNSLTNIAWGSVSAGDTVVLSGGTVSKTYTDRMNIGASGTAGKPITITGASDVGHNGTVIVDGSTSTTINTNNGIIEVSNRTYLVIQKMTLQNCLEMCVYIHGVTTGTVVVQNLVIHTGTGIVNLTTSIGTTAGNSTLTFAGGVIPAALVGIGSGNLGVTDATASAAIVKGTTANSVTSTTIVLGNAVVAPGVGAGDSIQVGANSRGIRMVSNSGGTITIQNCTINTPVTSVAQTDGIFFSSNSGCSIIIQGNTIDVDNYDTTGHSDCIQSFSDAGLIRNNLLLHSNGGSNNHGIIVSDPITGGAYTIYNNVINMSQSAGHPPETGIFLQATLGTGFLGSFNVYANTIYGGLYSIEFAPNAASPTSTPFAVTTNIRNNLIFTKPETLIPYFMYNGHAGASPTINNNLVYNFSGSNRLINTGAGRCAALGTVSQTTGLRYFEFQLGGILTSGNTGGGVGNASATLTFEVGHTTNSIGYIPLSGPGEVEFNNGTLTNIMSSAAYHVIGCAVDFTHSKIWWIDWSAATPLWNNAVIGSQNPATNTGGIALSVASGPYFIMLSCGAQNDYIVLNATGSFLGTMPSGFSAWGGTLNSGQIGTGGSLLPYIAFDGGASNTYNTWATWQGFAYDANGVNSDPLLTSVGTDYHLLSGSPARNAGAIIGTVTSDKDGDARPAAAAHDIGAYQF